MGNGQKEGWKGREGKGKGMGKEEKEREGKEKTRRIERNLELKVNSNYVIRYSVMR